MSAAAELVYVHDERLARYQLGPDHPFRPERQEVLTDLLRASDLLAEHEVVGLDAFDEAELLRVHAADYVDAVRAVDEGAPPRTLLLYGLGTPDTPAFPRMHEAIARVVAATVTAVDAVASGRARRAASFAGGLHHAMPAAASGFCVYNDLAVAIDRATDVHGLRVAYLDLDAHHGDGVQAAFYTRPDVLTVSLHETGRTLFPGTGFTGELGSGAGLGANVNVPLEPYTEDEGFALAFEAVVPKVLRDFAPDLIVLQAGADMHRDDPLAHLSLGLRGLARSYRRVAELADEVCEGRLVTTGGGGYRPYTTAPRAWAQAWAALAGRRVPERLPEAWRERWRAAADPEVVPECDLDDDEGAELAPNLLLTRGHAQANARRVLHRLEGLGGVPRPR